MIERDKIQSLRLEYEKKLTETLREFRTKVKDIEPSVMVRGIEMRNDGVSGHPVIIKIRIAL